MRRGVATDPLNRRDALRTLPEVGVGAAPFGDVNGRQVPVRGSGVARGGVNASFVVECAGVPAGRVVEQAVAVVSADPRYRTVRVSADSLRFARTYRPTWSFALGVLLVPVLVGIPLLLHRVVETCTILVEADHRGTRARVSGRLDGEVLARLRSTLEGLSTGGTPPPVGAPVAAVGVPVPPPAFSLEPNAGTPGTPAAVPPVVLPAGPAAVPPVVLPAGSAAVPPVVVPADVTLRPGGPRPSAPAPPAPAAVPVHPVVQLDDGTRVEIAHRVHLGRDPEAFGVAGQVVLVPVADPDRSVSKTHLALALSADRRLLVSDLNSTNGSFLVGADGEAVALQPGEWAEVPPGACVRFGRRTLCPERPA